MKEILIFGAAGMAGTELIKQSLERGLRVTATYHKKPLSPAVLSVSSGSLDAVQCDMTDRDSVRKVILDHPSELIFPLASLTSPSASWTDNTAAINLKIATTLLQELAKANQLARVIIPSSINVYGPNYTGAYLNEMAPLDPREPYGISKQAIEQITLAFSRKYPNIEVVIGRPGQHTAEGRIDTTVERDAVKQVQQIESGLSKTITMRRLNDELDIQPASAVVAAYFTLAEKGLNMEAYNITRGRVGRQKPYTVRQLVLDILAERGISPEDLELRSESPVSNSCRFSSDKLQALGWKPTVGLNHAFDYLFTEESSSRGLKPSLIPQTA